MGAGGFTIDDSALVELEQELDAVAGKENEIAKAAEVGALRAVKAHRVPVRTGELRETGYARASGGAIEAGYTSPHMGRDAQRTLVLRDLDSEVVEAAAEDAEKKLGEIVGAL